MTIHRGLRGSCSQPLPESSRSLAISPGLIATRRTQPQLERGSRITRRARAPSNQPLQRTTKSSFQLALVATWRHTQSQDRARSALSLAAERRSAKWHAAHRRRIAFRFAAPRGDRRLLEGRCGSVLAGCECARVRPNRDLQMKPDPLDNYEMRGASE